MLEHAGGAGAILARAISFAATIGVIGAVAFRRFVIAPALASGVDATPADQTGRRIGIASALVLLVVEPFRVILQAKGLALEGDPWAPMVPRILSTSWGHAATWQVAGAIIAAGGLWNAGRGRMHGWTQARVGAIVLAIVPAFMGHATATAQGRGWAIGADVIHVIAAGSWAGGLGILTLVALRMRGVPTGGVTVAALIDRFHLLAQRSVVALVLTGIVSAWLHLTAVGDLPGTPYGRILLVKVALVFVALVLGWRHSKTAAQRARAAGTAGITTTLRIEWGVLMLVLFITGLLTGSPPPGSD